MAKRSSGTARPSGSKGVTTPPEKTTPETIEQRVVSFAQQLGRLAGTVQAKAEGWMDRDALNRQIASVRDGAADLLEQLARTATPSPEPAGSAPDRAVKKRSGGVVDAPGKKHRPPLPADPAANLAASQAAKLRTATPMAKTIRRRGRG
ncbi:MAG: hypothetical protein ABIX28_07360 [Vicinamibacterales bacterium]